MLVCRWLLVLTVGILAVPPCAAHHGSLHPPDDKAEWDRLFGLADELFHEGDYLGAVRCNRQLIAMDPTYIDGYTNAAWLLWSLGRGMAAFALLERGRERNPKAYELHFDLGFYHYQGKRYSMAAKEFARAADCDCPQHPRRMLAHALERKGDLPGALQVWEELHKKHPEEAIVERHRQRLTKLLAAERR